MKIKGANGYTENELKKLLGKIWDNKKDWTQYDIENYKKKLLEDKLLLTL